MPQASTAQLPSASDVQDDFLALVYADGELVRAEFEEMIAAQWPSRPVPPRASDRANGRPEPTRPPRWTEESVRPAGAQAVVVRRWEQERSPPPR